MLNDLKSLVGKQVLLHKMDDDPKTNPIPPNTKGTIISVDDMGYYKVQWENGRVLNLLPDEDDFEFLDN